MLHQNERVNEGKTLKTEDPIQNRDQKKPKGDSKKKSVSCGTEVTAESETSTQKIKRYDIIVRESRELDT